MVKLLEKLLDKLVAIYGNRAGAVFSTIAISGGINAFTNRYEGNPIYHISGALAGAIARLLDHLSTIPSIRLENTPEVLTSDFRRDFIETNPITGPHPTMRRYIIRSMPQDLLIVGICLYYPPVGYAYLISSLIIYRNNYTIQKKLEALIEQMSKANLEKP